jgi:ubiquinone/menaquinone biosynthesis C-methylase UbiE
MKDNFSRQADGYAKYRPQYPQELFDYILEQVDGRQLVWDCATGNGQSARLLARYFERVFATDISQKQIDKAETAPNIIYSIQQAEQTNFADNSFDLITVSQALHWFATEAFFSEVKRISKPDSVFAAWAYSLLYISPEIDQLIRSFYTTVVGPYWDAERKYVDEEYNTIPFPFKEIKTPKFDMEYSWTLDELEGYINTWSALQKFITVNNYNPVPDLIHQVKPHWKPEIINVRFPLHVRMGRVEK